MGTKTTISSGNLEATVDSLGAELVSLKLDGEEYLWQADSKYWGRHAPVLFPIVGRIRNNEAVSAQGPVHLKQHGLARNLEHTLVSQTPSSVTYELVSTDDTRKDFPFDFKLNMTYSVADGKLTQQFEVTNTGDVTLPYTAGGHPAFNVPAPKDEGTDFSEYVLKFAEPWTYDAPTLVVKDGLWDQSKRMQLLENSDTLHLNHPLFDVDTLVFHSVPQNTVRLEGPQDHGVELDFPGLDYLGVWSAAHNAPFVAVEPWMGPATSLSDDDVFEHKTGMELLEPGASSVHAFTIRPF